MGNDMQDGRVLSDQALVNSARSGLRPLGFDPSRAWQRFREVIWPPGHVHEWHDWYVFDSSAQTTIGPRPDFRITGQQIMMICACGDTKRKHLRTWREARLARKRLPYKRWGIWSFSLAIPDAIAMAAGTDETERLSPKGNSAGQRHRPKGRT